MQNDSRRVSWTSRQGCDGGDSIRMALLNWHRRLGQSFKTVVALTESGATSMVITDLPEKIPGVDVCAACAAAKEIHFPHKEGYSCAGEYLGRVHIDIARPMKVNLGSTSTSPRTTTLMECTHAHYGSSRKRRKPSRYSRP